MITKTLSRTKNSTYAVIAPNPDPKTKGFPTPMGTGFFISSEGYFITARHVIEKRNPKGNPIITTSGYSELYEGKDITLTKCIPRITIYFIEIIKEWPEFDLVLLKADINKNKKEKDVLASDEQIEYLDINFNIIKEGSKVYSFGYPLSKIKIEGNSNSMFGFHFYSPRITSMIISSHYEVIGPIFGGRPFPKHYVLDKALNYGSSGSPVVEEGTGCVISVCTKFQPVYIPQQNLSIMIPSLYGISISLKNIENELRKYIK
ncbi:MAG: serine protease [Methanocellales archaeon]|nr:serine protease [Methanocellales archaeon]MDD3291731.1 serine protease [Methanocellales archaeon]MDD5235081.1 serine protease [Methanocellales archaeon]MDD5485219.1 serine protease [Methanocellales archaeon]